MESIPVTKTVLVAIVVGFCLCYGVLDILKAPPPALTDTPSSGLSWQDCWFPTPVLTAVYCGYLRPDEEARIPIVLIRRSLFDSDLKPLLYVNGGPGGPTIPPKGDIDSWVQWLKHSDFDRDLVLFDFLGTGRSEPGYACPQDPELAPKVLAASLSLGEEVEIYQPIVRDCYQDLTAKNLDLTKLRLPYTVQYVSQLINAIPEVDWDLYGVSYGTRVLLELMRQPPPNIRKVVLDSVVPPDINAYQQGPRLLHDALTKLFASCRVDWACREDYGDLEYEFYELVERLDEQPVEYQVEHPQTGEKVSVVVNGHRLVSLVYQSMYDWFLIEQLPSALWALKNGRKEPLQPMVELLSFYYLDETFNSVVSLSAGCSERGENATKEVVQKAARAYPRLRNYFRSAWKYDLCKHWTIPTLSGDYWESVRSSLPTLILAGELDPVTPPEWGKRVTKGLQNSHLLLVRGVGHGVVNSHWCGVVTMRAFLQERFTSAGSSCGKDTKGPEFVTKYTAQ